MRQEIKKIFSAKFIYVLLAILIAYFGLHLYNAMSAEKSIYKNAGVKKLIEDVENSGLSDEEKCEKLQEKKDELFQMDEGNDGQIKGTYGENINDEISIYGQVSELANYLYKSFPTDRKNAIREAMYHVDEEQEKNTPNKYVLRSNKLAISKYNRVVNLKLKIVGNQDEWYFFFNNTMWDCAYVAFVVMITVRLFTMDEAEGTYQMIETCKLGKRRLFFNKLKAITFVSIIILTIQSIIELVYGITYNGLGNMNLPLQMFPEYEMCPFHISIAQFYLIKYLLKIFVSIYICVFTMFICSFLKKPLFANLISLLCMLGMLFLTIAGYVFVHEADGGRVVTETNAKFYALVRSVFPTGFFNLRYYFDSFDYVNFFGYPGNRLFLCIIVSIFVVIVGMAIGYKKNISIRVK